MRKMKPMPHRLRGIVIVCVLSSYGNSMADTNSPEATVQLYMERILTADTNGAISLMYIPDQVPTHTLKHYSCENRDLFVASVRERVRIMICEASDANAAGHAVPRVLASCVTNRFAVVIVSEVSDTSAPEGQRDLSTVYLIKTREGWKVPFDAGMDYGPLLPEDGSGRTELQWLHEWAIDRIRTMKNKGVDKTTLYAEDNKTADAFVDAVGRRDNTPLNYADLTEDKAMARLLKRHGGKKSTQKEMMARQLYSEGQERHAEPSAAPLPPPPRTGPSEGAR